MLDLEGSVLPLAPVAPTAELPATDGARARSATLEEVERGHIVATLEQMGWVIDGPRGAAHILALHPNTLRSRMEKLGIKRPRPVGQ